MLEVKDLSFSYGRRKKDVLSHFSLSLQPGQVYGLLGKNGTGKSTSLYLMSGLLTPRKGQVMYRGTDVRRRLPVTLGDLFLVPEEFELPSVTLNRYIKLTSGFYPRFSTEDMKRYRDLFDLDTDVNLGALSMGQKKKVFMCFALATHTSLLLMDEPTNGLDIPGKSQFRKLIASGMDEERCVIISTHQVRDIDRMLDHIVIIDESRVLLDRSVSDICATFSFRESDDPALAERALYALPSLQGNSLMLPNERGEETEVNLELLFGAALAMPERIAAMFHS